MRRRDFISRIAGQILRASTSEASVSTSIRSTITPTTQHLRVASIGGTTRGFASEAVRTRGPVSYVSLGLTMATGAGIMYWYQQEKEKKLQSLTGRAVVVGQAAIGGPFNLLDSRGKPFTEKNLVGNFSMIYFGFTHCPDICPEELEKVAEAVDIASKKSASPGGILPVFITVDPERDTPALVGAYVKEFHPRMVGLSGSTEAVREAAKAYRVYFTRAGLAEVTGSSSSTGGKDDDDYLIDHSIITYLLDPEGKFVTFYGKNYTAEDMGASVAGHVEAWKRAHPEWKGTA